MSATVRRTSGAGAVVRRREATVRVVPCNQDRGSSIPRHRLTAAQWALVVRHMLLVGWAVRRFGRWDPEGVANEALSAMMHGVRRYDRARGKKTFGTFAKLVIQRRVLNYLERELQDRLHYVPLDEPGPGYPADVVEPLDAAVRAEGVARLRRAVEGLAPLSRLVVYLRFWSGMTFTEIGATLGLSREWARLAILEALAALRSQYDTADDS